MVAVRGRRDGWWSDGVHRSILKTSQVLAKGSGRKDKSTNRLRRTRSSGFVSLDRVQFVRDGMTATVAVRKTRAEAPPGVAVLLRGSVEFDVISAEVEAIRSGACGCGYLQRNGAGHFGILRGCSLKQIVAAKVRDDELPCC